MGACGSGHKKLPTTPDDAPKHAAPKPAAPPPAVLRPAAKGSEQASTPEAAMKPGECTLLDSSAGSDHKQSVDVAAEGVAAATPPLTLAVLPTACLSGMEEGDISGVWRHSPLPNQPHVYKRDIFAGLPEGLGEALDAQKSWFLYWHCEGTENRWQTTTSKEDIEAKRSDCAYPIPDEVDKYSSRGYVSEGFMFHWNQDDEVIQLARALQACDASLVTESTGQEKDQLPGRLMIFERRTLKYDGHELGGVARLRASQENVPEGQYVFELIDVPGFTPTMAWDSGESSWVAPWFDAPSRVEEGEKFKSRHDSEKDIWFVWDPPAHIWNMVDCGDEGDVVGDAFFDDPRALEQMAVMEAMQLGF